LKLHISRRWTSTNQKFFWELTLFKIPELW
jgi:hypothetical protein